MDNETRHEKEVAAFFDLDLTIVRKDTFRMFLRYWYLRKMKNWKHLPATFLFGLLRKLRLISLRKFKEVSLLSLKGMSKSEIEHIGKIFYEREIESNILQSAIKTIDFHRNRKEFVFLVSGCPDIYLNALAEYLNVDKYFCTELLYRNNSYTGRIKGSDCLWDEKVNRIKNDEFIRNLNLDFNASYAYADGESDIPLLSLVGNPCIVNPNVKMRRWAAENKWQIQIWSQ